MDPLLKLKALAKGVDVELGVVFGGDQTQTRSNGTFYSWLDFVNQYPSKTIS